VICRASPIVSNRHGYIKNPFFLCVSAIMRWSSSSVAAGTENDTSSKATGLESWENARARAFSSQLRLTVRLLWQVNMISSVIDRSTCSNNASADRQWQSGRTLRRDPCTRGSLYSAHTYYLSPSSGWSNWRRWRRDSRPTKFHQNTIQICCRRLKHIC